MGRTITSLAAHRPVAVGAGARLAWLAVLFATEAALPPVDVAWPQGLRSLLLNVATLTATALAITWLGWWRLIGVHHLRVERSWWVVLPPLAVSAAWTVPGIDGDVAAITSTAVVMAAIAMSEELLGRGLILVPLRAARGDRYAVWASAAIFGLGHLVSGLWFSRPVDDVLFTVVSAAVFGAVAAAIVVRTGSLWPAVLLHLVDNTLQQHGVDPSPGRFLTWRVLVLIGLAAYAWWLVDDHRRSSSGPVLRAGDLQRT